MIKELILRNLFLFRLILITPILLGLYFRETRIWVLSGALSCVPGFIDPREERLNRIELSRFMWPFKLARYFWRGLR